MNLSSDVLIKKVSTEKSFSTMTSISRIKTERHTNYNQKEIECYINFSGSNKEASDSIYRPRTKCAKSLDFCMNVSHAEISEI